MPVPAPARELGPMGGASNIERRSCHIYQMLGQFGDCFAVLYIIGWLDQLRDCRHVINDLLLALILAVWALVFNDICGPFLSFHPFFCGMSLGL